MRIVIDLQGAQSNSRTRGIGRYTLSLAHAIVRNRGEHEIILVLSDLFPHEVGLIRQSFHALLRPDQIRVWIAPAPVASRVPDNRDRRQIAELIYEAFIASIKPDAVLVMSLFEGYMDDAVTSIERLAQSVPVAVILYDLIPLLNPQVYLDPDPVSKAHYLEKIAHLKKAHTLLAISESSRQEAINHLPVSAAIVSNISTAADAHFQAFALTESEREVVFTRYGITRSYLMYTGGGDHRKNIDGLIRAYSLLSPALLKAYQLVIVCSLSIHEHQRLQKIVETSGLAITDVVFTNFVSEEDLLALYNCCELFVFPSLHEGFGLPVLEAMSCGCAVIASNTSSLPEVVGRADALFDPHNVDSIAQKMTAVLEDPVWRAQLKEYGLVQSQRFTWDISAQRALHAIEKMHLDWSQKQSQQIIAVQRKSVQKKPLLAFISPMPPERSGISDYSAELLEHLDFYYQIELIVDQKEVIQGETPFLVRDVTWFIEHANTYERVLYHFGNSTFHQHMFDLIMQIPGVIVLHDFYLSGIIYHADLSGFKPNWWPRALYHSHGYSGLESGLHASTPTQSISSFPVNLTVLQQGKGIVVHSPYSQKLLQQWYGTRALQESVVIPLLRNPPPLKNRLAARAALNLEEQQFVVCSFGVLARSKLNHRLLHAWLASSLSHQPHSILVFVGDSSDPAYSKELLDTIQRSHARDRIYITGWADPLLFKNYLMAADLGVQLRSSSRGETSAAVLDCLNYGLPTIINANGSMDDIHLTLVCKLEDKFEDTDLISALESLYEDSQACHALGLAGEQWVHEVHAPEHCADLYHSAIEDFYREDIGNPQTLMTYLIECLPTQPGQDLLKQTSQAIANTFPAKLTPSKLLIDISAWVNGAPLSEIDLLLERALRIWLLTTTTELRVEPIYTDKGGEFRYARSFVFDLLDCNPPVLANEGVDFYPGDQVLFLAPDTHAITELKNEGSRLYRWGLKTYWIDRQGLPTPRDLLPEVQELSLDDILSNTVMRWIGENQKTDFPLEQFVESVNQFFQGRMEQAISTYALMHLQESPVPALNITSSTSPLHKLFLDISATRKSSLRSGIERVVHSLLETLLHSPPAGYEVQPVYLDLESDGHWQYRYAQSFLSNEKHSHLANHYDAVVYPQKGDQLIVMDLSGQDIVGASTDGLYEQYRHAGVLVYAIAYDLLPIQEPQFFPPGTSTLHQEWLSCIANFDGAFGISQSVAADLQAWRKEHVNSLNTPYSIGWFHLGADQANQTPTKSGLGIATGDQRVLTEIKARTSFLMVGTLEPRKGYLQAIEAFTQLWNLGVDVNLIIVGKEGWTDLPGDRRRSIPNIIRALGENPHFGKRLFWLEAIDDAFLRLLYQSCNCLIAASEGEGFGLPLIEAAQFDLPIIARDLPVFREVAKDQAYYFKGSTKEDLAHAVQHWITLYQTQAHPQSFPLKSQTWKSSAQQFLQCLKIDS